MSTSFSLSLFLALEFFTAPNPPNPVPSAVGADKGSPNPAGSRSPRRYAIRPAARNTVRPPRSAVRSYRRTAAAGVRREIRQ